MKLYKYISSKYISSVLKEGKIRFNSLRYYRTIEDKNRRDENDGNLKYKPNEGIDINLTDGRKLKFNGSFESSVNDKEIYIFCLSNKLCPDLANKFGVDSCIEIFKPDKLFAKMNKEIKKVHSEIKPTKIFRSKVTYYEEREIPKHYWAIPEQIVLRKLIRFKSEYEYRVFFSFDNAINIEKTTQILTTKEFKEDEKVNDNPYEICIGDISRYCKIHRFKTLNDSSEEIEI